MTIFQQDYWRLDDEALSKLASKYNIPPMSLPPGDGDWGHAYVDRPRIIGQLVQRDTVRRTTLTTVLSIVALLVSIFALLKSFFPRTW